MTTLVTGALGCIGAWAVKHLVEQGQPVVSFDLADKGHRIDALMTPEEQAKATFVVGDLRDFDTVLNVMQKHNITKIIHLAALQVPFCRADPVKGAQVNVVGTVNIFEAAKQMGIKHLAQASSIAVYGAPDDYDEQVLGENAKMQPRTLYGVYKQADEGIARVYWNDYQLSSVALRPFTVYGVGRDQGLTSDPTKAMLHAVAGKPFHIGFGGKMQMQLASDTALQFIAAANTPLQGSFGFNMGGNIVSVEEIVNIIREEIPTAQITHESKSLPFPEGFDDSELRHHLPFTSMPLRDGISHTLAHFKALLNEGRMTL
jgi:nucleoside-diphosphate-sugar epimerase